MSTNRDVSPLLCDKVFVFAGDPEEACRRLLGLEACTVRVIVNMDPRLSKSQAHSAVQWEWRIGHCGGDR